MPLYSCSCCNFSSKIKTHFNRHLKTNKHEKNVKNQNDNLEKGINIPYNSLQNPPILEGKSINSLQNPPISEGKKYILADETEILSCENCGKEFSRQDNLKRHIEKRCAKNKETKYIKDLIVMMKEEHIKEKENLKDQIELLLDKVGNNNISVGNKTNNTTINNTIVLNNYGQEDLSHITDALKTELLKIPYGMIPKMIEEVHFNSKKPENKNIILTNSRDNKLKVYKNNKWVYKDKTETLNDLVDSKYFILDTHFETFQENEPEIGNLNDFQFNNYKKFRDLIDTGDKNLFENIKKDCELLLLNNR